MRIWQKILHVPVKFPITSLWCTEQGNALTSLVKKANLHFRPPAADALQNKSMRSLDIVPPQAAIRLLSWGYQVGGRSMIDVLLPVHRHYSDLLRKSNLQPP
ncbi:unnamed protein product [Victoria cruziana]